MDHSDLGAARRFMTGEPSPLETGAHICVSCGRDTAVEPTSKALSATFNQIAFFLYDSPHVCGRCLALFKDKDSRSKCLLWTSPGQKRVLAREEVLPLLKAPPPRYVLGIPYSFQKHTFFYAGMSSASLARVSTDNRQVVIDYQENDVPMVISQIGLMLAEGVPRKEVETGDYNIYTRSRYGKALEKWESVLYPMRHDGAIELFVKYTPAVKTKLKNSYKDDEMFTESENQAIDIMLALAASSRVRKIRPLEFWGGEFKRRLARFQEEKDLHVFVSKCAEQLQCGCDLDISLLKTLEMDKYPAIMKDIKDKLDILMAATFTAWNEQKAKTDKK